MIVLVVDDDADDRELFQEALGKIDKSIKCWTSKDGLAALDLLKNEVTILPDFIFLDVNMPIMGGKECLRQIKNTSGLKQIPVIIYSTTRNPSEIEEFQRLGAIDFLVKPSNFQQLISAIKSYLIRNMSSKSARLI